MHCPSSSQLSVDQLICRNLKPMNVLCHPCDSNYWHLSPAVEMTTTLPTFVFDNIDLSFDGFEWQTFFLKCSFCFALKITTGHIPGFKIIEVNVVSKRCYVRIRTYYLWLQLSWIHRKYFTFVYTGSLHWR